MVEIREFSDLGVVTTEAVDQSLDRIVHIESHPPSKRILDHALKPEEGGDARAPRDRSHQVQAGRWIEDQMARGQLDPVGTIVVVDLELAAIVLVRLRQE